MPRTTSSNYDTLNTGAKSPVCIVELLDPSDTVIGKYCSGPFANIGSTGHKKYVRKLRIFSDTVDVRSNPFVGATNIDVELIDKDLDVTGDLNSDTIVKIQAKIGFQGLDDTDFVDLPIQNITTIQLIGSDVDSLGWHISSRDARTIFTTATIFKNLADNVLNGDIDDSTTTVTLSSASDFVDPANLSGGNGNLEDWFNCGLIVDGERMAHTATSGANLTVTRAALETTADAHDSGALVRQFFYTNTDALEPFTWADMLLFIVHTTEDASGHEFYDLARLDSNFGGLGLGLSTSQVETENIERLGYQANPIQMTTRDNFYVIESGENAVEWINANILIPNGIIMFFNSDGKLDCKFIDLIEFGEVYSAAVTLDDDKIVSATLNIQNNRLRNFIELIPTTPLAQKFAKTLQAGLDSSISEYNQSETLTIRVPTNDLLTSTPVSFSQKWLASRWLYLFGNPPAFVGVRTNFENWIYTVGDYANVTWEKFPDLNAGTRGWTTEKSLIIGQEALMDFASEPPIFDLNFDLFCWEALSKVGSFYTRVDKIEEGDITDTSATLSATETLSDPPEAADAHYDFTTTANADLWAITVRVTPPNSGSTEHTIQLSIDIAEDSGGYTLRGHRDVAIRYNSGDSAAFTVEIYLTPGILGISDGCDRVYVQWYAASAGASERPTSVELIQVEYYTLDQAITLS